MDLRPAQGEKDLSLLLFSAAKTPKLRIFSQKAFFDFYIRKLLDACTKTSRMNGGIFKRAGKDA